MIEVNKSRKNVINLENDDWETELDKEEVYMTRFATHQTSSDEDSDDSEDDSASRTSKKSRSQRSGTSRSQGSKSAGSESEDESENTVPEDKPTIHLEKEDLEDFDDINETVDQETKMELVKTNKPGPASFDTRNKTPREVDQKKIDYINKNKHYVKQKQNVQDSFTDNNSRSSDRAPTPAYRFSFAEKNVSEEKVRDPGMTIDMLQNIQKTKDHLGQTAKSAYNIKKSNADEGEYSVKAYKSRAQSTEQMQNEMQMRPTVSPKELQEVQKYSTVQNILKNKSRQGGRTQVERTDTDNNKDRGFIDDIVKRNREPLQK